MSARKKSSRRKPTRPGPRSSLTLKLWLAGVFLVGFVLVSLLVLNYLQHRYLPVVPGPGNGQTAAGAPAARPGDWSEVLQRLAADGWPVTAPRADPESGVLRSRVTQPLPASPRLQELAARLAALPAFSAEVLPGRGLELIRSDGQRLELLFLPVPVPPVKGPVARLAIIVDDLGRDLGAVHQLLDLGLPLTFSILPDEPHTRATAVAVHEQGREVLIHIPMEPQAYPAVNPGSDALFVNASPEELRRRVHRFVAAVPYAVGGNNHMGSRFTEDPAGMAVVLGQMREAGLFFVDSRTTGASVAYDLARRAGIPVARRDLFLDNVQDPVKIGDQIRKLIRLARRRGFAIGICHPHPATLVALRQAVPELEAAGLQLVPVSELVAVPQKGQ